MKMETVAIFWARSTECSDDSKHCKKLKKKIVSKQKFISKRPKKNGFQSTIVNIAIKIKKKTVSEQKLISKRPKKTCFQSIIVNIAKKSRKKIISKNRNLFPNGRKKLVSNRS